MRTAICDIAEGTDMRLETGSVPGLSYSLYGSVDFEEDYREVTGRLAVGKMCVRCPCLLYTSPSPRDS